ncbi:unnamed protein product [Pelagomonas calceolata]|uniref:Uncharacterized protein n=1 Tax=Pelagomonas calceolata TaxID=35677 RepID=A0A8J2SR46_9STRA|nr:unnamed protein product [Pelagomonas calceolata]
MEETKTEPGQPDAAADATACDWSRVGYRWGLLFLVMGGGFFVGATLLATGARRAASNGDGRRGPSYDDATCDLLSVDAQKTQTSRGCYDVFRYAFRGTGEATRHFDAASVLNCTASTCDECATNTRSPVAGRVGDVVPCFRQKGAPHDCEDCFALVARPDPIWLEARYRPWTQFAVAGGALLVVSVSAACLLACAQCLVRGSLFPVTRGGPFWPHLEDDEALYLVRCLSAPVDAAAYQRFYVFFVVAGGLLVGASLAKLRRGPSLAVFGGLALMTAAALRLAVASGARRPGKDEGKVAAADQWRHHGFDGGA